MTFLLFCSPSWPDISPGLSSLPSELYVQPYQDAEDQHYWDIKYAGWVI